MAATELKEAFTAIENSFGYVECDKITVELNDPSTGDHKRH